MTRRDRSTRPFRRAMSLATAGALALSVAPLAATAQEPASQPRSTDLACPGEPSSDFSDIGGSVHEDNIRCLADLGLTVGLRGGDRYGPRAELWRGQMASLLHRFVTLAADEEPPAGPDAFPDDDGLVHEPAIDALAALGIVQGQPDGTFRPFASVTRGQLASFVVRTLDHLHDGELNGSFPPAGSDAFGDDDGSTHEEAIDALAALGVVQGFPDGTFRPGAPVTRDQVATYLVRAYDVVLEEGLGTDPIEDDVFSATIRRTAHGVPHIEAEDAGGIAYGMGYVNAQDTICELMDRIMTANAERAMHLGPGTNDNNVISDLYHARLDGAGMYDPLDDEPGAHPDSPSAEARSGVAGYVAGVNRYLEEVGGSEGIDDPRCQGEPWVRPIEELEYWRVLATFIGAQQAQGLVNASPPDVAMSSLAPQAELEPAAEPETVGSNAYAFGSEATENGRGALLGNPHYPWTGPLRFYRTHLTIPGELNVVGAALMNTPFVGIGHTDKIAWTHTVSTAQRFGLFQLELDPDDPTRYMMDGESVPMERNEVSVQVRQEDGSLEPHEHTFYETPFGTLIELAFGPATLGWTEDTAFTFQLTVENLRLADQYLAMSRAEDVEELYEALGEHQATPYNTTATDHEGGTFFGDVGAIPNITDEHWERCLAPGIGGLARSLERIPILRGWESDCQWGTDEDSAIPGIFGQSSVPHLFRDDHVSQMNDSHWLTNPDERLEGYPLMFGAERTQRSLRTRLGVVQIEERLAGEDGLEGDKVGLEHLQQMLFGNRVYPAELVRDDLVAACRASEDEDLAQACDVLADWDLRVDVDSRGAHLFIRYVNRGGLVWSVPFDPDDPVHTPNTLDTSSSAVLDALRQAVADVRNAGVDLDAPWGEIQTELRPVCFTPWSSPPETRGDACVAGEEERIPIHGGPGGAGVFNVITGSNGLPSSRVTHGASWLMTVVFTDDGPVSEGLLTYSQSTNPESPHHSDQTRLYSQEGWDPLLFDPDDVREAALSTVTIGSDD